MRRGIPTAAGLVGLRSAPSAMICAWLATIEHGTPCINQKISASAVGLCSQRKVATRKHRVVYGSMLIGKPAWWRRLPYVTSDPFS
jgi:hypothetical protein